MMSSSMLWPFIFKIVLNTLTRAISVHIIIVSNAGDTPHIYSAAAVVVSCHSAHIFITIYDIMGLYDDKLNTRTRNEKNNEVENPRMFEMCEVVGFFFFSLVIWSAHRSNVIHMNQKIYHLYGIFDTS